MQTVARIASALGTCYPGGPHNQTKPKTYFEIVLFLGYGLLRAFTKKQNQRPTLIVIFKKKSYVVWHKREGSGNRGRRRRERQKEGEGRGIMHFLSILKLRLIQNEGVTCGFCYIEVDTLFPSFSLNLKLTYTTVPFVACNNAENYMITSFFFEVVQITKHIINNVNNKFH